MRTVDADESVCCARCYSNRRARGDLRTLGRTSVCERENITPCQNTSLFTDAPGSNMLRRHLK